MLNYQRRLKLSARNLRKKMTDSEQLLWSRIRRSNFAGFSFIGKSRSVAISWISTRRRPDWYSKLTALSTSTMTIPKTMRYEMLNWRKQGLRVMRFNNLQVLNELESVLEAIIRCIQEIPPSPPLTKGGEGGFSKGEVRE
jgi:very-short-patch-repair endonuclease